MAPPLHVNGVSVCYAKLSIRRMRAQGYLAFLFFLTPNHLMAMAPHSANHPRPASPKPALSHNTHRETASSVVRAG